MLEIFKSGPKSTLPAPLSVLADNIWSSVQLSPECAADHLTSLVFDVSDLIHYFQGARLPTGIQRVQIELITNLTLRNEPQYELAIACFTKTSDTWLMIRPLFFNHICRLALIGGDASAPDWTRVLEELEANLAEAQPVTFSRGAYLINLGTSWWLRNYFLHVRNAKARFGIRYVPFVHDCIPIITPEHCTEGLTRDFISWAVGAFQHADHILVNSQATAQDVLKVASFLGHDVADPVVLRLDADYRSASHALARSEANDLFLRNDIRPGGYVLFVATIESRKNHVLAFSAWLALIKKYGLQRVPKLVCVGNRGWLNDAVYAKLEASKLLRSKVVMLSHISDPDLARLYEDCLFTLYPSSYEGWGLPVTESLCFGKVPVLARTSSLPEAGGEFAEYFDLGAEDRLIEALDRLIFNEAYRSAKESVIARDFRARPWLEIADQMVEVVKRWDGTAKPVTAVGNAEERGLWPFEIELGTYNGISETEDLSIYAGMLSGEVYRQGDGWWWPEPWGCWTKAKVARLAFVAPIAAGDDMVLFMGVRGVQTERARITISLRDIAEKELVAEANHDYWMVFRLSPAEVDQLRLDDERILVEVLAWADKVSDFGAITGGTDPRVASVGIRGMMVCRSSDVEARMRFVEAITINDVSAMSRSRTSGFLW